MRQRGAAATAFNVGAKLFARPKVKDDSVFGFAPARVIEQFSFMNPKHTIIVISIIITIISLTGLIHGLLNDFDAIESKQKTEIRFIEDLFQEEHQWMQSNHEKTVESLKISHQTDIDNELKWFLDEMKSITEQKVTLETEHKDAGYKLQSSTNQHEFHSKEQKELDDKLNKLYTSSSDKIEHLNNKLAECDKASGDLDLKIASAKRIKDGSDNSVKDKIQQSIFGGDNHKYDNDDNVKREVKNDYLYKYK
eukprot:189767_1